MVPGRVSTESGVVMAGIISLVSFILGTVTACGVVAANAPTSAAESGFGFHLRSPYLDLLFGSGKRASKQ
jgi:hypothetical protein